MVIQSSTITSLTPLSYCAKVGDDRSVSAIIIKSSSVREARSIQRIKKLEKLKQVSFKFSSGRQKRTYTAQELHRQRIPENGSSVIPKITNHLYNNYGKEDTSEIASLQLSQGNSPPNHLIVDFRKSHATQLF